MDSVKQIDSVKKTRKIEKIKKYIENYIDDDNLTDETKIKLSEKYNSLTSDNAHTVEQDIRSIVYNDQKKLVANRNRQNFGNGLRNDLCLIAVAAIGLPLVTAYGP